MGHAWMWSNKPMVAVCRDCGVEFNAATETYRERGADGSTREEPACVCHPIIRSLARDANREE